MWFVFLNQKSTTQQAAQGIISRVSHPSKAEAKALATYFPPSNQPQPERESKHRNTSVKFKVSTATYKLTNHNQLFIDVAMSLYSFKGNITVPDTIFVIGACLSEPHIVEVKGNFRICMYVCIVRHSVYTHLCASNSTLYMYGIAYRYGRGRERSSYGSYGKERTGVDEGGRGRRPVVILSQYNNGRNV